MELEEMPPCIIIRGPTDIQPIPLHEVQAREGKDGAIQLKVEFHRGRDTIGLK
jgi:hypothetical protein